MIAPYTQVPITHPAFAYVPSHEQTPEKLGETFKRFEPIRVCPVKQEKNSAGMKPPYPSQKENRDDF